MTETQAPSTFRRNIRWQLFGSASQALLSGIMLLLVGRELKAAGFGEFSIIMGYVYVANLLLEPRMHDVAARHFWDLTPNSESQQHHRTRIVDLFVFEVASKLVPCAALVCLSGVLARLGNLSEGSAGLIVVAALGIYAAKLGNGLSIGLLRVLGRSDLNACAATGELMLRLVLTLAVIRFGHLSVTASILILVASGIASNLLQWALTATLLKEVWPALREWKLRGAVARLRDNRRLIVSNVGLSVADLMNKDLDITLISPLMPAEQVGIYKMAKNLAQLTWRAIDPFYIALMPEVTRLVSTRAHAALDRLIAKTALGLFGLAIGLSLVSLLALTWFGNAVLGPAYAAVPALLPWMLAGVVIGAPLVWGHPLSVALNRADLAVVGSVIGSVIGLVSFLWLTPDYGTRGAGIAWTLTFIGNFTFIGAAAYWLLRRRRALQ